MKRPFRRRHCLHRVTSFPLASPEASDHFQFPVKICDGLSIGVLEAVLFRKIDGERGPGVPGMLFECGDFFFEKPQGSFE
jgi:hypothetical protein